MKVLHVGASGLVGRAVLSQLLADLRVEHVVAPGRRPLPTLHPRLHNPVVDFEHLPAQAPWWRVDAVICTLGTTLRQAGSQAAFRRVDHDYPLEVARRALDHGAQAFALNSSMGADAHSRFFYLRVKGELEQALGALAYPSLTCVRPGFIGGARSPPRPAEVAVTRVATALGPVLPRRWRINPAERVAAALVHAAVQALPGRHVVEAAELA